jgi:hypothetical protein
MKPVPKAQTMATTIVFRFFQESSGDIAKKAFSPMLDSLQFSYRIKKRAKMILNRVKEGL